MLILALSSGWSFHFLLSSTAVEARSSQRSLDDSIAPGKNPILPSMPKPFHPCLLSQMSDFSRLPPSNLAVNQLLLREHYDPSTDRLFVNEAFPIPRLFQLIAHHMLILKPRGQISTLQFPMSFYHITQIFRLGLIVANHLNSWRRPNPNLYLVAVSRHYPFVV